MLNPFAQSLSWKSVPKVCESNMRSEENRLDTTTSVRRVSLTQGAAHAFQKEKILTNS